MKLRNFAGGKRGMKVFWQVTGVRQDAYANAHRVPVEEDKPAQEIILEQVIDRISIHIQRAAVLRFIAGNAGTHDRIWPAADRDHRAGRRRRDSRRSPPPASSCRSTNKPQQQPNFAVSDGEIVFNSPGVAT
jgi:hypothetical protein